MTRHGRLALLATVLLAACAADSEAPSDTGEGRDGGPTWSGHIVPEQATDLRAPQNSFRIAGTTVSSGWVKVLKLVPDDSRVEEGDFVAQFEFRGDNLLPKVQAGIDEANARQAQSEIENTAQLRQIRTDLRRQRIEANRLALETRKEGVVSRRQSDIAKIAHQQAVFEVRALERRLAVLLRKAKSEADYHTVAVRRAREQQTRFESIKARFSVRAQHSGVVRHARSRRERRKFRKGDGMPAGYKFSAIAKNEAVELEFYVPETRVSEVRAGMGLTVEHPASGETATATVTEVRPFPQELGFLRDNRDMAGAREKIFVVRARFSKTPRAMKVGVEVRVRGAS